MAGLSRREFARRAGCSEAYVRKAIAHGRIEVGDDGKIDPAWLEVDWRKGERPADDTLRTQSGAHTENAHALERTVEEIERATEQASGENVVALFGEMVSKAEAERVKENALARLRQLEYSQKCGQLVEVEPVRRHLFDLWRQERDAWVNWPGRVAALMAAELGVDATQLQVMLEKHVRQHLEERSDAPPDRLAS